MRIISTAAAILFLLAPASVALAQAPTSPDPSTKAQDSMQQGQGAQNQQAKKQTMHRKSARHKKPHYLHHKAIYKTKPHKTSLRHKRGNYGKAKPARKAQATTKHSKANSGY